MFDLRTVCLGLCVGLAWACAADGDDPAPMGDLGQACIGGSFCNGSLVCIAGTCAQGNAEGTGSGDGDGSPGDGDGDGSPGDGDGDGSPGTELDLYEGPCATSNDCAGDLWCSDKGGRSWCAMDCIDASDCPAHASAGAAPDCKFLDEVGGLSPRKGCVLACTTEVECPSGAQCFYSGLASDNWCGFLD